MLNSIPFVFPELPQSLHTFSSLIFKAPRDNEFRQFVRSSLYSLQNPFFLLIYKNKICEMFTSF